MSLPVRMEEALDKLKQARTNLNSFKNEDLSESDTRSKVIDYLFKEVLGWGEDHIRREGHSAAGYYDYRITVPGFTFLVEAKRGFADFKLPHTQKTIQLKFLLTQNKEVCEQMRKYCIESGVPFGVLTNGHQFALGQFNNVDGTDWKKNNCLVFDGFADIEARFMDFFQNLSLPGIVQFGGFSYNNSQAKRLGQRLLTSSVDGDRELVRNSLSGHLTPVIDKLFGEMFSDGSADEDLEFIKQCFVDNEETKQNREEIDKLFADIPPVLSNVIPAKHTDSLRKQIAYEIHQDKVVSRENPPPKPIIAIGSKGAGKTTFINHLFRYKFTEERADSFPWIYVDFRRYQDRKSGFDPDHLATDILSLLHEKYPDYALHTSAVLHKIYEREIRMKNEGGWSELRERFPSEYAKRLTDYMESLQAQPLAHLEYISKHLIKDRRKRLIVIIDNTDQFGDDVQEKIFIFAHALNRTAQCGVVISLREGYYYRWRNSPPFDAYESNVYHITAPPYSQVLQKRLDFAISFVNPKKTTGQHADDGKSVKVSNETILNFLKQVRASIFNEHNAEIVDYLKYTTHTNIREGLRVFKIFLISGHTNVADLIFKSTSHPVTNELGQRIPFHQFIRSIGLQNKVVYDHSVSVLHNLFFPGEGGDSHFLKYFILRHLANKLGDGGTVHKYQQYSLLLADFGKLGFKQHFVRQEITDLLKSGLLDSQEVIGDTHWSNMSDRMNVSISSKGFYYLNKLMGRFEYLDMMLQDTPIYSTEIFSKLKMSFIGRADANGRRCILKRKECVEHFIEYLEQMEDSLPPGAKESYGLLSQHLFDHGLQQDVDVIGAIIEKQPLRLSSRPSSMS